ncbi:GH1 family beta-glucosidase [Stackebrandtia nassauensis]|uniref:Beta-glucosidase n=1 Tax=Stackebrandtia nassauensis (strain DSM 44728 / CIP 108903 / NRRL B-16338 / NBRC 102104 / LLR-40K-21) TaxID=446470 RepID=D3Q414_STANL|nr:GH1 family beta-glucosidase [Stackebrandtia nassauensis]ADD45899.1 beta-galactosidase [Stackebrandtia nassauensis DSM 44728]
MTRNGNGFGPDFTWGAASSAYQVEGAATADGRGPSIWDTFAAAPGRVVDASTGETAVEAYHRVDEDVAVMRELGLRAYRFSVSWPRVVPDGTGAVNQAGLDYYRRLTDRLLDAGIEPWVTLYHWDLPQPLEDAGGWPERDTALRFADYALTVHEALSDRVDNWITVNEPWCAAFLGYASGEHAPGRREPAAAIAAAHHLLLGHGLATTGMRSADASSRIAIGLNFYPVHPASDRPDDVDAARRVDGVQNRLFTEAVLRGAYPSDVLADFKPVRDPDYIHDGDLRIISTPIDRLCVNYYSRFTVTGTANGRASASAAPTDTGSAWPGNEHIGFVGADLPVTGMGWEIDPDGLRDQLLRLAREYPGVELVVTENGAAFDDVLSDDGTAVHDQRRLVYLRRHVAACAEAIAAGVPLSGYFVWSLMDNFEWAWGYTKRFGVVYVDFETQRRVVKDSGHWYRDLIAGG